MADYRDDEKRLRSDLQMIERAVKRRWNFDKTLAEQAVEAGLKSPDPRIQTRALAVAVQMEKQNQADEHKVIDIGIQQNHDRLASIAAELGLDPRVIEAIAVDSSGDSENTGDSGEEDQADNRPGPQA